MRRAIAILALTNASAFLAPLAPAIAKTVVFKKKDKDAADGGEPVQINAMSKGTVVEFALSAYHASRIDGHKVKAKAQRSRPVMGSSTPTTLGVIDGHKVKDQWMAWRWDEIKTADGKDCPPRDIHFSAPGAKNNLDEMLQVLDTEAPALVDPEVLEICYEVAAEEEKELGLQQIASLLDAGSSPVDIYRTFRVLSASSARSSSRKRKATRSTSTRAPRRRWRPPSARSAASTATSTASSASSSVAFVRPPPDPKPHRDVAPV